MELVRGREREKSSGLRRARVQPHTQNARTHARAHEVPGRVFLHTCKAQQKQERWGGAVKVSGQRGDRPFCLGKRGRCQSLFSKKNCLHLFPRPVRHAHALYYREKLHVRHESECTFWGFGQNWRLRRAARGCCKRRVVTADGRGKLPQRRLLPATFCARDTK